MDSQLKANIQSWEMSYVLMSLIDGKSHLPAIG